mmetsp:Transcript_22975/g.53759  ORF Transcript_22975/g.53759 Transcript_22975/m.53759 type:complete len:329 (-) Transcript_22975:651-1637(-)
MDSGKGKENCDSSEGVENSTYIHSACRLRQLEQEARSAWWAGIPHCRGDADPNGAQRPGNLREVQHALRHEVVVTTTQEEAASWWMHIDNSPRVRSGGPRGEVQVGHSHARLATDSSDDATGANCRERHDQRLDAARAQGMDVCRLGATGGRVGDGEGQVREAGNNHERVEGTDLGEQASGVRAGLCRPLDNQGRPRKVLSGVDDVEGACGLALRHPGGILDFARDAPALSRKGCATDPLERNSPISIVAQEQPALSGNDKLDGELAILTRYRRNTPALILTRRAHENAQILLVGAEECTRRGNLQGSDAVHVISAGVEDPPLLKPAR